MLDAEAQGLRAVELVRIVFRPPHAGARPLIDLDRRIHHDGRGRVAVVERRRVDERLERRARLAQRLRRAIELALVEREAADHREHAAGERVHRDDRAGDFRDLAQAVLAGVLVDRSRHRHVAGGEHLADTRRAPCRDPAPAAALAHFTPSIGMLPIRRSFATPPPGSRAGLQPDARRLIAHLEHDRDAPRHVGERLHVGELHAPVAGNIELLDRAAIALASRRTSPGRRSAPCGRPTAASDRAWCAPTARPHRASSRRSGRSGRGALPRRNIPPRRCARRSGAA